MDASSSSDTELTSHSHTYPLWLLIILVPFSIRRILLLLPPVPIVQQRHDLLASVPAGDCENRHIPIAQSSAEARLRPEWDTRTKDGGLYEQQ